MFNLKFAVAILLSIEENINLFSSMESASGYIEDCILELEVEYQRIAWLIEQHEGIAI